MPTRNGPMPITFVWLHSRSGWRGVSQTSHLAQHGTCHMDRAQKSSPNGCTPARPRIRCREGARDSRLRRVHARLISPSGEVGEVLRGERDGTGGDVLLQVSKGASAGDSQGDWREG